MASLPVRAVLLTAVLLFASAPPTRADVLDTLELNRIKGNLRGQVLDFTRNHGRDRRLWSPSLCSQRDVYVYLPPCYSPANQYPVIFYLHGFAQDERTFYMLLPELDRAIASGSMPPTIVIAPDGSVTGRASYLKPASFYINSNAGNFEDYLMRDVWDWAHQNFSIRPGRESHALAGASMGGGAAFDIGMRHRDRVGVVAGIFPPLNLRWLDCKDNYMGKFDPSCWAWREQMHHRREVIASYFGGVVKIRIGAFVDPLFGFGDHAVPRLSEHNPIEHIDRIGLKNGDLAMYVAYGGKDEFNLDAQAESFLHFAKERGIDVSVDYLPRGRHDTRTALKLLPGTLNWLGAKLK